MKKIRDYVRVNGVKVELTDRQKRFVQQEIEKKELLKKSPYSRVRLNEHYYTLCGHFDEFTTIKVQERNSTTDNPQFMGGNYCNNRSYFDKIAHQINLFLLLDRYSWENDGEINWNEGGFDWNDCSDKFKLVYNNLSKTMSITPTLVKSPLTAHFKSRATATKAIEEVIEPYLEQHNLHLENIME